MNRLSQALRTTLRPLKRSRLFSALNLTLSTEVAGRTLRVPIINGIGYSNVAMQEEWMVDVLRRLLPHCEGAFVDVGVNVGQTLLKVKAIRPDVPYVGFEPNPACVYYVTKLIEANGFRDCVVVPVGLHDRTHIAALNLYEPADASVGGSIEPAFRPDEPVLRRQFVPVFSLPDALSGTGTPRVGVLKLDAEGVELEILQGAGDLLARQRPFVLVEILPAYTAGNAYRVERQRLLVAHLRDQGYRLLSVLKTDGNALRGFEAVDEIGVHADPRRTDYVAVPVEAGAVLRA